MTSNKLARYVYACTYTDYICYMHVCIGTRAYCTRAHMYTHTHVHKTHPKTHPPTHLHTHIHTHSNLHSRFPQQKVVQKTVQSALTSQSKSLQSHLWACLKPPVGSSSPISSFSSVVFPDPLSPSCKPATKAVQRYHKSKETLKCMVAVLNLDS